jgi:hypothetical protein
MLKLIFAFIPFLFLSSSLYSQNFSFGVEIGGTITNLDYNNSPDFWSPQTRNSLNAFIWGSYSVSDFFAVQSGLRFVQLGSHIEYEDYPTIIGTTVMVMGTHDLIQNYISIPLRVSYSINKTPLFVFFGPELGYLLSSKYEHDQESPNPSSSTENITSSLEKFNYALNSGLGFKFKIGRQNLYIAGQYSYGLMGVAKEKEWFSDWKTREVSLLVGYIF